MVAKNSNCDSLCHMLKLTKKYRVYFVHSYIQRDLCIAAVHNVTLVLLIKTSHEQTKYIVTWCYDSLEK